MESIKFLKVDEKNVDLLTEDEMKRLFKAHKKIVGTMERFCIISCFI